MKVQCHCGSKFSIAVTPEMADNPVKFVCPNCNVDLSAPINELIRQELGVTAAPVTQPVAPTPATAPAAPLSTRMRVAPAAPPTAPEAPPVAAPARLSLSKSASSATHGTAVETQQPGAGPDEGKPCPKHQGEISVAHCYICRKPICPKCMELFGFVCSPLCRAKAESNGINVPVYEGQKSVIEAKQWRKMFNIGAVAAGALVLLLGVWIWWTWIATVPHAIFSVRFPEISYAGNSRIVDKNQLVFLHGGLLARYPLGSKKPVWTNEIISQQQFEVEVDRQMNSYRDMVNNAAKRGVDSSFRPRAMQREELEKVVREYLDKSLQLYVHDKNIWVERDGKLTQYDWDTGKAGKEITLPEGREQASVDGEELQYTDENGFGQHVVTHVSLATGESHTEEIGDAKSSATLAMTQPVGVGPGKKQSPAKKDSETTGLPTTPGKDMDKPMDPAKVAEDAQNLPYAAKMALPATLSNVKHQNELLKEMREDDPQDVARKAASGTSIPDLMDYISHRGFINNKYGLVEWHSKVLERLGRTHKVMKDKPARSALESNPSVTNQAAIANEILNDMQRENGGDSATEDVSRYQVTVHRLDDKNVPDWVGEVIGPPDVIQQKTVTIVAGGEMFVVLDKSNKKLWQANLSSKIGRGSGLDENDPGQTSPGLAPCVEKDDTLYVIDDATLTAFDLANGNVRWRVPTIGILGIFFDDKGSMYVNSTTADLESLRYTRQIDINKKITASVLRINCKTGKVDWKVQPGGFVSHVDGKFVFCFASHQAPDLDPDSLTTLPGMLNSAMDIRRLDPNTGKTLFDYPEPRCPLSVRFNGNVIELVFRKEVEVLKFLSL